MPCASLPPSPVASWSLLDKAALEGTTEPRACPYVICGSAPLGSIARGRPPPACAVSISVPACRPRHWKPPSFSNQKLLRPHSPDVFGEGGDILFYSGTPHTFAAIAGLKAGEPGRKDYANSLTPSHLHVLSNLAKDHESPEFTPRLSSPRFASVPGAHDCFALLFRQLQKTIFQIASGSDASSHHRKPAPAGPETARQVHHEGRTSTSLGKLSRRVLAHFSK